MDQPDRLLSVDEVLHTRIPVHRTTLQLYIKSGALRSVRVGGRRFITESAVQAFVADLSAQAAASEASNA